jgi:F420-dependent oxidoreductase-like protein
VKVGVIVPQGWTGEYNGWQPGAAWTRTVAVAKEADRLGFESIWLFDHFHTVPKPTDELTFESFTALAALAAVTNRVRLGHIVVCNGYRNPALVAKMIATMDVIAGGRMELGIGAGWKRDEWLAYGYGFPETRERLAALADGLGVFTPMLAPGSTTHGTFEGRYAHVKDAINLPKGLQQPRVPIMVGGNGPNVTWRLAARHADELNVDGMSPQEVRDALPTIRARCEEIGRDPDDLRLSVHIWWGDKAWRRAGESRRELLREYAEAGVDRVMGLLQESARSDEPLAMLAQDARAAGMALAD